MGDFRIPYGMGFGRYGNFQSRTDNLFGQGDATPDVTNGTLFFTNNASSTTITDFEFTVPGGGAGTNWAAFEGKEIKVFFLDDSTRLASNSRIFLSGSNGLQGPNVNVSLIYHNSAWYETSRSYNQSNVIVVDSNNIKTVTGNPFMNASTGNINVTGRGDNIVINMIHDSTGNWTMRRAVGGEQGARITLIAGGDSHSLVIVNSAAADTFVCVSSATSTQFRLASSAAVQFVRYLNKWHEIVVLQVQSGTAVQGQ